MRYSNDTLLTLYDKTAGRCHICRRRLLRGNYGVLRARGAWEVDHSRARARGGSNYRRNLLPACIPCNRRKLAGCTRAARRAHGFKRAPISRREMLRRRLRNASAMGTLLGVLGALLFSGDRASLVVLTALLGVVMGSFRSVE